MSPLEISPDQILNSLPGVSHVLLFNEDGTPTQFASLGTMPEEWTRGLERFAGSVTNALKENAQSVSISNQTAYAPVRGWFYAGGDWCVCVSSVAHLRGVSQEKTRQGPGFVAAFFKSERADPKKIFDAMVARNLMAPGS